MLAVDLALVRLLLCLVIVRDVSLCSERSRIPKPTETPEVAKTPAVPEASRVVRTSTTPIKPRIVQRTTVLKRPNRFHYEDNSPSSSSLPNYEEDDSTSTTHPPGPVSFESTTPKAVDFRPSIHLGEIEGYETRKSATNPFGKVQDVKFENSVRIGESDTDRVRAPLVTKTSSFVHEPERTATVEGRRKKNNRVKFLETDSRYGVEVPIEVAYQQQEYFDAQQQNEQHMENDDDDEGDNNSGYNYPVKVPVDHEALVTFVYPQSHYGEVTERPVTSGRPVYPSITSEHAHVQHYEPGTFDVQTIYVKPSKFHGEVEIVTPVPVPVSVPAPVHIRHYDYARPASGEAVEKPEVLHHYKGSHQVLPQVADVDNIGKPETVLYLTSHRETAYTRTRKFPYQFHHPGLGYQENEYHFVQEGTHASPSKGKRISPWKKIFHLIGTFLPLGLLLATLTPNVVRIGNTTQPNIVLPKLRVVDLPAEHKQARLVDEPDKQQQNTCEDRSVCELIVSGSEPRYNLLQNILWNLMTKSSDEEAKKHGLHDIFAAAKRKDCSAIEC